MLQVLLSVVIIFQQTDSHTSPFKVVLAVLLYWSISVFPSNGLSCRPPSCDLPLQLHYTNYLLSRLESSTSVSIAKQPCLERCLNVALLSTAMVRAAHHVCSCSTVFIFMEDKYLLR